MLQTCKQKFREIKEVVTLQNLDSKKGMGSGKIAALIGALIFIVLVVALAPTMFTGLNETGGPSWMDTVLPVIVGAGIVFGVWRAFK